MPEAIDVLRSVSGSTGLSSSPDVLTLPARDLLGSAPPPRKRCLTLASRPCSISVHPTCLPLHALFSTMRAVMRPVVDTAYSPATSSPLAAPKRAPKVSPT